MDGCDIPRALKDYQENKTLSQVANCLANIEILLLNKPAEEEESQRKEELEVEDERKQVPAMTKTNSRTRTKSKLAQRDQDQLEGAFAVANGLVSGQPQDVDSILDPLWLFLYFGGPRRLPGR